MHAGDSVFWLLHPGCAGIVCWYYEENLPPGHDPHPEDLDHGAMDMSYVGLLMRNFVRLGASGQRFNEPLAALDWQGLAGTFIRNASGSNFAHDIAGQPEPSPYDANSRCEGWLELARVNPQVYSLCHDVTLRVVDGVQPHLNIGNHSSLLANKQFSP
jgi:hypothetical protein